MFGVIDEDITLTAFNEYLVSGNVIVSGNAIVTIEPGTILKLSDDVTLSFQDNSKLICVGTRDDKIKLMAENVRWNTLVLDSSHDFSWHTIKFTEFSGFRNLFGGGDGFLVEDCLFYNSNIDGGIFWADGSNYRIKRTNIVDNFIGGSYPIRDNYIHKNISEVNIQNDDIIDNETNRVYVATHINYINNISLTSLYHLLATANYNNPYFTFNAFSNPSQFNNDVTIQGSTNGPNSIIKPALYLGTSLDELMDSRSIHYFNDSNINTAFEWSEASQTPFEEAHGIVWKVEVNGFDAQDEYALLDPLGVGTHEFKVYFNREMDTSVDPQVSYGVTIPYNQNIMSEQGTWSEDGKIYTVTHEINIGAADGINRIRVQDAQDLDYFKIPVEDSRFNFLLQSAGSASTGFFAAGGLGKIDLEWVAPSADELDDVLGYNMYRYQIDEDGNESEPEKLNESLIVEDTDESYHGGLFHGLMMWLQGQTYFYKYKILRTSFEETDYSSTVSSAPLTSDSWG